MLCKRKLYAFQTRWGWINVDREKFFNFKKTAHISSVFNSEIIGQVHTQKITNTGLGVRVTLETYYPEKHQSAFLQSRTGSDGHERKNPVKPIMAVRPDHTILQLLSQPSHPPLLNTEKIPSVWDLFISDFGWCTRTKRLCVCWPLMSYLFFREFSSRFHARLGGADRTNLSFEHTHMSR